MKTMAVIAISVACLAGCSKDPYTKAQDEFVTGCERTGVPEEICECTFAKVTEVYSKQGIITMYNSGQMPPDFMNTNTQAMEVCMAQ